MKFRDHDFPLMIFNMLISPVIHVQNEPDQETRTERKHKEQKQNRREYK